VKSIATRALEGIKIRWEKLKKRDAERRQGKGPRKREGRRAGTKKKGEYQDEGDEGVEQRNAMCQHFG